MPSDAIVVAILSFFGTCFGSWGGIRLMSYRIEQLEKRVEKHNKVVERMYALEEEHAVHIEKIKVINHRLDDLEKGMNA